MRFSQFGATWRILPQPFQDSTQDPRERNPRFPAVQPIGPPESVSPFAEAFPQPGGTLHPRDSALVDLLISTLLRLGHRILIARSKHADCIQRLNPGRDEENQLSRTFESIRVFKQVSDHG